MNNPLFIEQVWWTLLVWFATLSTIGVFMYFYNRHKGKKHDENFEKRHRDINDRWVGQIPPVKNPLPPPPELKNAMPRAVAPDAPKRFFASDEEAIIVAKEFEKEMRKALLVNVSGVKKIVFQNGQEIDLPRSDKNQKGRYEPNDNGIVVWNTDEKSAPWVSVDFAPPLDPTNYPSDSGSSNSDSTPTDFSGGDFGGGGAGGDY